MRDGHCADIDADAIAKLPNKAFVFKCLDLLIRHDAVSESDVSDLMDEKYCRRMFPGTYKSILKEDCGKGPGQCIDRYGHSRYYCETIVIYGRTFFVYSEWYGLGKKGDNRTPFLNWVLERLSGRGMA